MKMFNKRLCIVMCLIFIIGCEGNDNVIPEKVAEVSATPQVLATVTPSSIPSDTPALASDHDQSVSITLEPRGYLKAPIKTIVADTPQIFTIVFPENMNQTSVEDNLLKSTLIKGDSAPQVKLHFNWQNETKLQLTVTTVGIDYTMYAADGYTIDVNGAVTSSGKTIVDAPTFRTVIQKPQQIWKVSLTDGHAEQVSDFNEPFYMSGLYDAHYMLATQFLDYCECDATLPKLNSVYHIEKNQLTTYPVPLMVSYKGRGDFVADSRGFFYELPKSTENIPSSDTAKVIHIEGYVHGASFSHDRQNLLLAVGKETQEVDMDFVIYNLETKKTITMPKKLIGQVPDNQVSSLKIPVEFHDDGTYVYSYMVNTERHDMQEYRYSWVDGTLEPWKSHIGEYAWDGFLETKDGKYRYYYNEGMYQGDEKIAIPVESYLRFWQESTHNFVYLKPTDSNFGSPQTINLLNVDNMKIRTFAQLLPSDSLLLSSSSDGHWFYVLRKGD